VSRIAVRELWLDGWRGPSALNIDGECVEYAGPVDAAAPVIPVTVLPGFVDSHVHLGLIDPALLAAGGIARVVDLGWIPSEAARWLTHPDASWPTVSIAGGLLAAPGGYPSTSTWAPAGATIEVASVEDARAAVTAMAKLGASAIKLTLNSVAGPVFDDALLGAIIGAAHDAGLRAVVHPEGVGQAERALIVGADQLAHAPFSERLSDETLIAMVGRCSWISTLDMHGWGSPSAEFTIALDNISRFHALGGTVMYGTDLGNGELPVGVNERELRALTAAGLDEASLLRALVGPLDHRLSVIGTQRIPDLPGWLATATVRTAEELITQYELLKEHP
jgi:imidazolonepropionase-like amidohydrolase